VLCGVEKREGIEGLSGGSIGIYLLISILLNFDSSIVGILLREKLLCFGVKFRFVY